MSERPVIDIVTFDSRQCPICTYMLEIITSLPEDIKQHLEFKEWSIKDQAGINKFMEHKFEVLPTIAINGEPVFEGLYPSLDEVLDVLEAEAETDELKTAIAKARTKELASSRK